MFVNSDSKVSYSQISLWLENISCLWAKPKFVQISLVEVANDSFVTRRSLSEISKTDFQIIRCMLFIVLYWNQPIEQSISQLYSLLVNNAGDSGVIFEIIDY